MDMRVTANDESAARYAEQRGAPRSSLMMRVAKLICGTREYVCVVRDVSATGVKVRLFHQPPLNVRVALELANGERHAMQRVWAHDFEAGFRFDEEIVVARFMAEPSSHPRRPIRLNFTRGASVVIGEQPIAAIIRNLSQEGACLELAAPLAIRQRISITIDGLPQRAASVRWRRDNAYGLVFQDKLTLDGLAAFALECQPYPDEMDGWEEPPFPKPPAEG